MSEDKEVNIKQVKSKKRVADHGEVFTNEREVNAMLDLVKQETERIESTFLEPACGDGAISEVLKSKGHNVYSTDLIDRNYGDAHFDFMLSHRKTDNIITNPPFNIGTKFTIHSLGLASRKVAIFNKLSFLEGKERKNKIYSLNKLKTVYIFSQRVTFNQNTGGMLAFAWFVFDKNHNDDATIKFI
jgi:hypothetical protein